MSLRSPAQRPAHRSATKAQKRKAAAPTAELQRMGLAELVALRRLQGQAKRLLSESPDGPTTPLQRLAASAMRDEAAALAVSLKEFRDKIGVQMGQTKLRSRAVSAYTQAFRKT
jgi:hypothetical protein